MTTLVKEVMSHPAVTCLPTDTMDTPARLMWQYDCGAIAVVNNDGRLTGMVTDRDLCMAAYTQGRPMQTIPVATAMAEHPIVVRSTDTIETAQDLMRDHQIRRLAVLDDAGRPLGVVSLNDLARLAARARDEETDREITRTLAAICQPR
jgi:CBS domain-containing protein